MSGPLFGAHPSTTCPVNSFVARSCWASRTHDCRSPLETAMVSVPGCQATAVNPAWVACVMRGNCSRAPVWVSINSTSGVKGLARRDWL